MMTLLPFILLLAFSICSSCSCFIACSSIHSPLYATPRNTHRHLTSHLLLTFTFTFTFTSTFHTFFFFSHSHFSHSQFTFPGARRDAHAPPHRTQVQVQVRYPTLESYYFATPTSTLLLLYSTSTPPWHAPPAKKIH